MGIISQRASNSIKIIVDNIDKKKDIEKFISILDEDTSFEINFLNIQYLPKEIIFKLDEKKESIKIFTNESVLKSYLMNLGFDLEFDDEYIKNKNKFLSLDYLAIGGSAGSLKKFIEIVKNLPKSELSIFIIMHQKQDIQSSLSTILQSHTKHYKVVEAKNDMKVAPSTIYTAPAGKHMIVVGGYIFLTNEEKRNFSRPSISTAFESLSNAYKNTLLAIIVCGYGADGSDSLEVLQKNNTTIIVEDPNECEAKAMLENAIKTDNYDFVFSLDEINLFIKKSIENDFINDTELLEFLDKIYDIYGYDYRGYNLNHIKRRVHIFYNMLKPKNFYEFQNNVLRDITLFKDLFLNISVNITTFYRNPEVFKLLKDEILPKLDSYMDIKIWCAGCSSGEEPYSIAIFLKELGLLERSLIYATDLNEVVLNNAKNGLYSKENFNLFLKHYYQAGGNESFSSYFDVKNNFVSMKEDIRERILFFRHNLVLDGKVNDFQLIFCRNVIIYFDKDLKEKVFNLFHSSLDNYGFLVLGESESLDYHPKFKTVDKKNKIYKRKI